MKTDLTIVVDMQTDFVSGSLKNPEAEKILPAMVDYLKQVDTPLIFTRDTHRDNYLETPEGRKLPVPHCIEHTDGHQIVDELQPFTKNAEIIDKDRFASIPLAEKIAEDRKIQKIRMFGVCTDICVVSNALMIKAYRPDIEIEVVAPLCAGTTVENHQAALHTMQSCQISVVNL